MCLNIVKENYKRDRVSLIRSQNDCRISGSKEIGSKVGTQMGKKRKRRRRAYTSKKRK